MNVRNNVCVCVCVGGGGVRAKGRVVSTCANFAVFAHGITGLVTLVTRLAEPPHRTAFDCTIGTTTAFPALDAAELLGLAIRVGRTLWVRRCGRKGGESVCVCMADIDLVLPLHPSERGGKG
jgi:hypothetical protein